MELWIAIKLILGNKKKIIFPLMSVIIGISCLVITLSISKGGKVLINESLSLIGENRVLIGGDNIYRRDMELIEDYPFVQYAFFPEGRRKIDENIYIGYSNKLLNFLRLKRLNNNEIIIDRKQYPNKKIGEYIFFKIKNQSFNFLIKDIYEEKNPFELMKKGKRIIMSQKSFDDIFNNRGYLKMMISFYEDEDPSDYIQGIINKIKENNWNNLDLKLLETPELYKKIKRVKKIVNYSLGILSFISIGLGTFGIFNLIGNNIKARNNYIGLLRAVGMPIFRIKKIFIIETLIISIVGIFIGSVIGFIGAIVIGKVIYIPPIFSIPQILILIILSIVIGSFGGVYLNIKLKEESIIEILKRGQV